MRLHGSRGPWYGQPVIMATMMVALGIGSGCGGTASAPTPTAAAPGTTAAPAVSPVPTPVRPPLASPAPSPSPAPPAAAAATATPTSGPEQIYEVKAGDTLLSIAQEVYGDQTLWRRIYDANRDTIGPNPDQLKIEQKLKIPPKEG
jgi:5'-nucleotidase / UDP-sugar diphosphatase